MKYARLCFAAIWAFTFATPTISCINEYERSGSHQDHPPTNSSVFELDGAQERLKNLVASCNERNRNIALTKDATFAQLSDLAACLIYRGQYPEAIALLKRAESLSSDEYIVASNLGTAYELNGELPQAIEWIGKGIARNPRAHGGTEWLHLEILKAKLALATDPNWLLTHPTLGVRSPRYRALTGMAGQAGADELAHPLQDQLRERLMFVRPPDPVVADLFLDYANVMSRFGTLGEAKYLFGLLRAVGEPAIGLTSFRCTPLSASRAAITPA